MRCFKLRDLLEELAVQAARLRVEAGTAQSPFLVTTLTDYTLLVESRGGQTMTETPQQYTARIMATS
jgi:hypothetical protein